VGLSAPSLRVGNRAELVVVDCKRSYLIDSARLRSKSHNTPFLGRKVEGAIALTMGDGAVIFEAEPS
jgi:dihydroorotase